MPTRPDAALAALAASQHGAFSRSQAHEVGVSDRMLRHRVDIGVLTQLSSRVFAVSGAPSSWRQGLHAAALQLDAAAVSHRAAAQLHGFQHIERDVVELSTLHDRPTRCGIAVVHQQCRFDPGALTTIDGLPVTTEARTLIDLVAVCGSTRYQRIVESRLIGGSLDIDQIWASFETVAGRGRPNTVRQRHLLSQFGPGAPLGESQLEAAFLRLIRRARLPAPENQVDLPWERPGAGRLDAVFVSAKLVIELDGRSWHSRFDDFERDRRRDVAAQLHGWRIFRFTWRQVVHEPDYVLGALRAALASTA